MSKAFSLFEVLIYILVLSIVVVFLSQIILPVKEAEKHSRAVIAIENSLDSALNIIVYNIRQATSINSASGSDLSLAMSDASINPTVFSLSSSTIYIQQGSGSKKPITSSIVSVSSLTFEKISNPSPAKDSVKITISVHYIGPGAGANPVSKEITTVATLR